MTLTWILLVVAAAAGLAVGLEMARRPILVRVAWRNAWRRPRQSAMVVCGLMVGTAIVSAALVAGGSAGSAVRAYVYQSLGDIDESVAIAGYPYFPDGALSALQSDPNATFFDGITGHAIWNAAVDDGAGYAPAVALVGFDPAQGAGFGTFSTPGGPRDGRELPHGGVYVTAHLAGLLGAHVGDHLRLNLTPPQDPLLPDVTPVSGNLTLSLEPGLVPLPQALPERHSFHVNATSVRVTAVVAAAGEPVSVHLKLTLTDPAGTMWQGNPASTAFVNATAPTGRALEAGNWTLDVAGDRAVRTPYAGAIIVARPVYDLAELQRRSEALSRQYGDFVSQRIADLAGAKRVTAEVTVEAVTDGGRGSLFDFRDALFLRLDDAQAMWGRQGYLNLITLSNPGDAVAGQAGTAHAVAVLNATLARLRALHPDVPSYQSLAVRPLKEEYVTVADQAGSTLTNLLVFAGSLTIITGLLLLLNTFTVLAQERRGDLGMARAVGMSRGDVVRMFLFEGILYAVAAAAAGALLGLALAAVMVAILNAIIGTLAARYTFPPIVYQPTWDAVLIAFSTGLIVALATIFGASVRSSRVNVVRAIRRLEEPDVPARARPANHWGYPLAAVGVAAAAWGWGGWWGVHFRISLEVFGALVAAFGLWLPLRCRLPRRHLVPLLSALLGAYYAASEFAARRYGDLTEANVVGPVRAVLLALAVVILAVHWDALARGVGWLLARVPALRPLAIPAVSYPLHKKARTGLTLAVFAVVVLSISFFSIFGALFQTDPARQTGGYDVEAHATLQAALAPYDRGLLPAGFVVAQDRLRNYISEDPQFITVSGTRVGSYGDYHHNVYGYNATFVDHQHFRLLWRDPAYADDRAAYQGVLDHPGEVIVSYAYSTNEHNQDLAHHVGETLEMHLGDRSVPLRIVGIQEQYHFNGIFLPDPEVRTLFPQAGDLYLFRLDLSRLPGATPESAARLIANNYRGAGLDAQSSIALVLQQEESFRQILGAMKLFLGLGLVVGVLSLGIVTSRNVLERRQEIGMLRALGFRPAQVRALFFTEMTFTLLLGALIGVACALVVTYGVWFSLIRSVGYPYVVPWGELLALVGISYGVALLATVMPIGRSGRVAPAEALRYVE
ncbi:MAG: ABC transporter permease [Thermoplasmatota archaeon]